jgi:Domain of unknown function (DUF4124)
MVIPVRKRASAALAVFTYTGFQFPPGSLIHDLTLAAFLCVLSTITANAAVFRCVDSNGVNTYSDKPCSPTSPPPDSQAAEGTQDPLVATRHPSAAAPPAPPAVDHALSSKEAKARRILELLHFTVEFAATSSSEQRAIDMVAPNLVKSLDPTNATWNPQNGRWHYMLEFVKSDLRQDIAPALRITGAQTTQAAAREYAAHAQEADMDALLQYLGTPDGARYIAFQNVVRSISNQALRELMEQEPITVEEPSDTVLKQRQKLLSLELEARFVIDGGGPFLGPSAPGSPAILENAARREGTALDALYVEYEYFVPNFVAFTQSATAKRFFTAAEPAYRTSMALSSAAAGEFADSEEFKYAQRWQAAYGPRARGAPRVTTVVMRNHYGTGTTTVGASTITGSTYNGRAGTAESMAIQCEQREDSTYNARTPRTTDGNMRAAALKGIQDRCRAEQNLAPF